MIYIITIILLIFLIYHYDYHKVQNGKAFWQLMVTLLLIIIGGLHYRLGFDNVGYERYYSLVKPLYSIRLKDFADTRFAPGFVFLASFSKMFTGEMILFNFLQSGFVIGVVSWFFKKHAKNFFLAFLLFFVFMYTLLIFEQIREAISAAIFLLAWSSFINKRWLKWYALALCAMMFHTSALILLVLPIITLPGIRTLFVFGKRTILICLAIFLIGIVIQATFSKYIELLSVTATTEDLTAKYKDTKYVASDLNLKGYLGYFFRDCLYPIVAIFFLGKIKKISEYLVDLKQIETFALISIYVSLFAISIPILIRFNNYFFFFPIILISDWVFEVLKVGRKKFRFGFVSWMIILLPLFSYQTYTSYLKGINKSGTLKWYMGYYPYTSYLEKSKDGSREKVYKFLQHR